MNKSSVIYRAISRINRNIFVNTINKIRLKNSNFTIISNNCTGSLISHDLNQKFLSPTVNLYIYTEDFVKMVSDLHFYFQQELIEIKKTDIDFPVGKLHDIEIYFMHYSSFNEALDKWKQRIKRINYNNLFIMMTDNNGCSEETIRMFDELQFKNKVFFTSNPKHLTFQSAFFIKDFRSEDYVGDMTLYKNIFGKKIYDNFNYVNWLNSPLNSK